MSKRKSSVLKFNISPEISMSVFSYLCFVLIFSPYLHSSYSAPPEQGPSPSNPHYDLIMKWGSRGSSAGQFVVPKGIALDPVTHDLFVSDFGNQRVQKFKLSDSCPVGTKQITSGVCFVKAWGKEKILGPGQLSGPYGLSIDFSTHEVYVTDRGSNKIKKFTDQGEFIISWGTTGTGIGQFNKPEGVAVDSSNHEVYVADTVNHRIQKFKLSNKCEIAQKQIAPGVCFITMWDKGNFGVKFKAPSGISVDSSSHDVYVTDKVQDGSVQKFSSNGKIVKSLLKDGKIIPFGYPTAIAVDSKGYVYVTDPALNPQIQKFTNTGKFVYNFVSPNGEAHFECPDGIGVDPTGNLYLSDSDHNKILVFAWKIPISQSQAK